MFSRRHAMIAMSGSLLFSALLLNGCATPYRHLQTIGNGDDAFPEVEVTNGVVNLANLGPQDTVVVASGAHRYVSRSNLVDIDVIEPVELAGIAGLDGDGVDPQSVFNLTTHTFVRRDRHWITKDVIDLSKPDEGGKREFAVFSFNTSKVEYTGDIVLYDNLHPQVKFLSTVSRGKYIDQRATKAMLSSIPYVGLVTLGMEDFTSINEPVLATDNFTNGLLSYTFTGVTLKPGEGIGVIFTANIVAPSTKDLYELRKTAKAYRW